MVRETDGAIIPIATTIGENDIGRSAFSTLSESNKNSLNYFIFMHGYELNHQTDAFSKLYNLTGYGIEIYGINIGYYGYFQRNDSMAWIENSLKQNPNSFKVFFYNNPMFPG
mmetsp:Transcript_13489/g.13411  ORF Transcript_13489/g.13411 Transcript_13489/m.13411 type:complete len:112 (-) Transcript_13489:256-591(-)